MDYPPQTLKDQPFLKTPLLTGRRWFDVFVIGSIDPIIIFDEKLDIKFVNESGAKLFGRKTNELIGRNIETCDALGSIVSPVLQEVLKLKTGVSCDHEIPEDKHLRIFQGSYSPVLDVNNQALGIFSVLREVTDRRAMFALLTASNKRLQTHAKALEVFDIASESDLSGQILYVNDKFCMVSQYSRSELVGKNYRVLNSGSHSKAFFQEMWETISRGQPWLGEIQNRAKDGSTFWAQTIITPIFNEDGSLARFLSIQQNITSERDERFRIAGSALHFRHILDSNPMMVASLDLEQNIAFCNAALLKATGYLEKDVIKRNWFEMFIPSGEKQIIQGNILQLLGGKKPIVQFESQLLGKDGTSIEITWRATVIKNLDGVAYEIYLLGEPKKQEKQATDLLRQDVIGFVSHELKGGLISLESGLQLMQSELEATDLNREYLQTTLAKIMYKVTHIDDLSRNMMENLEKGSRLIQIRSQPTSLRTVLSGIWNRVKDETNVSRNLTFNLHLPKEDITVQWDPLKIEQALRNLISNAIQYSKSEGGKITLSAKQVNENILVSVSDEGIGVPPESVESMFDLFTRGSNTNQQQVKHFGIGLKLCKDIVSQHRGRIWIESKLSFGTTIFMLLPIDPKVHPPLSAIPT